MMLVIHIQKEGVLMQGMIRFSVFGNFERFNTNNFEEYMKLIQFFGQKGYKPATANELQLQPNGQARVLIMPNFIDETGSVIEITSNRINVQKVVPGTNSVEALKDIFNGELATLMTTFLSELGIVSGRVALNCEILCDQVETGMPTQSAYYETTRNTEMAIKNVTQIDICNEICNVILEKYVNAKENITKYVYDINSQAENQLLRFTSENIRMLYDSFVDVASEIEKGLK